MRYRSQVAAITLLLLLSALIVSAQERKSPYRFRAGQLDIQPETGELAKLSPDRKHLIVQFYNIPTVENRRQLSAQGLSLVRYVGGHAYLAKLANEQALAQAKNKGIRATVAISPRMKLSSLFESKAMLSEAVAAGKPLKVHVRFHEDVDGTAIGEVLSRAGLNSIKTEFMAYNAVELIAPWSAVERLLREDAVEFVDPALPPPKMHNTTAAARANVPLVYRNKTFKRPSGKPVRVGLWDGGQVAQHADFGARVTNVDTDKAVSDHTTHVAGTIAASGNGDANAMGMAPRARIFTYNFYGDAIGEMERAIADYDVMISNNSWGTVAGWDYDPPEDDEEGLKWRWETDEWFGYYHSVTKSADRFARNYNFPIIWAAGNDRNDSYLGPHRHYNPSTGEYDGSHEDLHPPDPEYNSLGPRGIAKNIITVGAVMDDDEMTGFSNWGPTDSGRMKPDVVANGYELLSTQPENSYDYMTGTSTSTPVVTGAAALLMHSYQRWTKERIGGDMLKALIIHSARDLGRPGPDYSYGYGEIDAELAAKVLRAAMVEQSLVSPTEEDPTVATIIRGSLENRKKKKYSFNVPGGASELRVTLVWNDPAGASLVNNLDLQAKTLGARVRSFTLNPHNPTAPAEQRRNSSDNVEHILVKKPKAGNWRIIVKGISVPDGPQEFALVISAGDGNNPPLRLKTGSLSVQNVFTSDTDDWDNVTEKDSFAKGDELYCYVYVRILENADYGGYYGTVTGNWTIKRNSGAVILRVTSASDGFAPNDPGRMWRWRIGEYVIPENLAAGTYTLEVEMTMHNGASDKRSFNFTVE